MKKNLSLLLIICIGLFAISCSNSAELDIYSTIHGTVTDYENNIPLENATVVLSPSNITQLTNASGYYKFEGLDAQQYTITVQKSGYQPNRKTIIAISGETQQVYIQLTPIPHN